MQPKRPCLDCISRSSILCIQLIVAPTAGIASHSIDEETLSKLQSRNPEEVLYLFRTASDLFH